MRRLVAEILLALPIPLFAIALAIDAGLNHHIAMSWIAGAIMLWIILRLIWLCQDVEE